MLGKGITPLKAMGINPLSPGFCEGRDKGLKLSTAGDPELSEKMAEVRLHSLLGDGEAICNLLVAVSLPEVFQDLAFPVRQLRQGVGGGHLTKQVSHCRIVQPGLPTSHSPQCLSEKSEIPIWFEATVSPRPKEFDQDVRVIVCRAEKENPASATPCPNPVEECVGVRKGHIEEENLGGFLPDQVPEGLGIQGISHDVEGWIAGEGRCHCLRIHAAGHT